MADDCRCLRCAVLDLLSEHYPDGIETDGIREVCEVLIYLSGVMLASCGDTTVSSFLGAIVTARKNEIAAPTTETAGALH